jgi:hypothetical protein
MPADVLTTVYDTLKEHDHALNTLTLIVLCGGFLFLFWIKGVTYVVIRSQRPQTRVGITLQGQKFWESWMFLSLTSLFFIPLWSLIDGGGGFGLWTRVLLRLASIVTICGAVWFGMRVAKSLRDEQWGASYSERRARNQDAQQKVLDETSFVLAKRGQKLSNEGVKLDDRAIDMNERQQEMDTQSRDQDATHIRQDAMDLKQDATDVRQDATHIRQDATDARQDATDARQDIREANQHGDS